MEIEYFVKPDEWSRILMNYWLTIILSWRSRWGYQQIRFMITTCQRRTAHISSKHTIDVMFDYPNGQEELLGFAYRTDFDLSNIQKASGKSMEYRDKVTGETFVPHVIEPSIGVERLFLAVMSSAYCEEEGRVVLKLPENLAPYKFCVSPLLKNKPELVERAREVLGC